ncbi:DUF397 domain-containing protein [Streptomyces sp. G45]|uniref:DUF397 domain-containing protein n=1 Tax=Streptomyces sp. G45 TaxID=3406627 RepID=UPI003C1BAABC
MSSNGEIQGAVWFKSSHSNADGNCLEVAHLSAHEVAARDSKQSHGPVVVISSGAWSSLVTWMRRS